MSLTTEDARTEDFLAHVGVKGMKWGVRTSGTGSSGGSSSGGSAGSKGSGSGGSSKAEAQAAAAKSAKRKKIAKIGGAALIAGGAVAVTAVLAKNGKLNVGTLNSAIKGGAKNAPIEQARSYAQKSASAAQQSRRAESARRSHEALYNQTMSRSTKGGKNAPEQSARAKQAADTGKRQAKLISDQLEWKKKIADVLGDLDQANADQDAWMRSLGLGATINNDKR